MACRFRLATRISGGFAVVLLLSLVLVVVAGWTLTTIRRQSQVLAEQSVPQVVIAAGIERSAQESGYDMRAYADSLDRRDFDQGMSDIKGVTEGIEEARTLATTADVLTNLPQTADSLSTAVRQYESICNAIAQANDEILAARQELSAAEVAFMENCTPYAESMYANTDKDIDGAATVERLHERVVKIRVANELAQLGYESQLAAWKAQVTHDPNTLATVSERIAKVYKLVDEVLPVTRQEINQKYLAAIRAAAERYESTLGRMRSCRAKIDELSQRRAQSYEQLLTVARGAAHEGLERARSDAGTALARTTRSVWTLAIGAALAIVSGLVLAVWITRSITRPLTGAVRQLTEGAEQVSEAANQVSNTSQELARGTSEQSAATAETATVLKAMLGQIQQSGATAQQANQQTRTAHEAAVSGDQTMARLNGAMQAINESSAQIKRVIKVIQEIAFQTNLLALNAAVEAARAGEYGKGFAIVAEEVRNLAKRAAQAADETTDLIGASVSRAQEGSSVATEVAAALGTIVTTVTSVSGLIGGLAEASAAQTRSVQQVGEAVGRIEGATHSGAAAAEESASAAEELAAQATCVTDIVGVLQELVHGRR
jgi:methyl-accepting chemotaxis protein